MAIIKLPGLIDPHVHLRDPGETEKEDFTTATASAIAGGYTTVIDMPNNKTPITTKARLEEKIAIARKKILCDVGFYFGTIGETSELSTIQNKVFGLKIYLNETTGNYLLNNTDALEKIYSAWNGLFVFHAEEKRIEDVIKLASQYRKPTHICHVATQTELQMISDAKEKDVPITCGVTPHHLFLSQKDEETLGPFSMVRPRLAKLSDVDFLWKHIGAIDVIESDHAPHTLKEKEGANPPYGIPGLETTLPLLLTAMSEGKLSLGHIMRLCFENPADIFHCKKDADTYSEIDLQYPWVISNDTLHTKSKCTPFDGWKVKGKILKTVIRGQVVFADDRILAKPGDGHVMLPQVAL